MVCRALDPRPGETICDCCAAPGGKAFTLAQEVGTEGRIYAFDLHEKRVGLIKEGAARLGLDNIYARVGDATDVLEGVIQADKVLCDVPCSGFGVIKRKPEIRYKNLESLQDLPKLQYNILQNASRYVRPGGLLLYSTCTLNPAENSDNRYWPPAGYRGAGKYANHDALRGGLGRVFCGGFPKKDRIGAKAWRKGTSNL